MAQTNRLGQPPNTGLKLYSVSEAAEILGCSGMHIYRLISLGDLPTVNIAAPGAQGVRSSKTRIRHNDLAAYIERKTSGAGTR